MQKTNNELPWLKQDRNIKIAVIGDLILDEYLDGDISRISPEAPVPVHLVTNTKITAGGAGNAARNIASAGGKAHVFGVCGKDDTAKQLKSILTKDGINVDGILEESERPTIRKTRVTSNNQQVVRIDWEQVSDISHETQKKLIEHLSSTDFDAILISDYGKGTLPEAMLQKIIRIANQKGITCVVDPKGHDYRRYQNADIITPNKKEAYAALGLGSNIDIGGKELGHMLQEKYDLKNVLVTLGSEGMMYVPLDKRKEVISKKPKAREVFDVSGAGDTVAATLTLAIASGSNLDLSLELSNLAAGIVVEKWGTTPVPRNELEQAYNKKHNILSNSAKKIVTLDELMNKLKEKPFKNKQIVFTNGCFDILHAGHVSYLEEAREQGDLLILGVNTDDSIKRLKGESRPLIDLEQRMKTLAGLSAVDYLVAFDEDTPLNLISTIKPHILVKGADYKVNEIVGSKEVLASGGKVQTIEFVPGISTSEIIKRARQ